MKFPIEIVHFIILISMISHGIDGRNTKSKSEENNASMKEQLNSLNEPPIKSFKKNGDIIDCFDIYKQPAFDHPLLKNHKFQRRPSSLPKPTELISRKQTNDTVGLRDEVVECPYGTVPFMRIRQDDLLRGKALINQRYPRPGSPNAALAPSMHYAAVTTPENNPSLQFFGAKTTISVYNSTVVAPQITEAMLWIGTGVNGPYNSIEYGWTINPVLYRDHEPRTYSSWTADGQQHTGCYNAVCPGYVQVSRKRIMGEVNKPVSIFGKSVYAMVFSIFRDPKTGNWWLFEDLGDKKNEPVGYWPKELFPSMKTFAKVVQIGGKVYSPPNMPRQTPMGSGAFIADDFTRTCYASNIEFVNSNNQFYVPKNVPMKVTADIPNTYKASYLGDDAEVEQPEVKKKKVQPFQTKCRPLKLVELIANLNEEQRKAVSDVGFGGLLELKLTKIPHGILKMLLKAFDHTSNMFKTKKFDFLLTKDDVHDIFQLPRQGRKVDVAHMGNTTSL
ncbi:protein neprosin-like [Silene latifolia]|uniref:protein neprosin-like n=1 Tax=Silene latifolia TaxID=37657 RepID=UPI003D76E92E